MTLISLHNALTRDPFRTDDYRIRATLGRTKGKSSVKTDEELAIRADGLERPAPPRRLLLPRPKRSSRSV